MCINNPRFPIYIISKGRWNIKKTGYILKKMKVPFYMVVEKNEYKKYSEYFNKKKLLILPKKYIEEYDTFWERFEDNKTGPGAARNFCWDHSIENGFAWHWVLDDNIDYFRRYNHNAKIKCMSGKPFYIIEDFVLRYTNIAISGMGYVCVTQNKI